MRAGNAVFDASVIVRSFRADDAAAEWVASLRRREVTVYVPDLVFAEVANAFVTVARVRGRPATEIGAALKLVLALPLRVERVRRLVVPATAAAVRHGLSAYDACYLALAEARRATLVTADRRLAAAASDAELLI